MTELDKLAWQKLSPLLDELLDASEPERAEKLRALEHTDVASAEALAVLLGHASEVERSGFLRGPAFGFDATSTLVGKVVGSYTLERLLGNGGMGSVWLARRSDGRFEGCVAIKFLSLALMGRVGIERFRSEGNALARLAHPNVARLLDAGVSDAGQPYLVLEYVEGQSLDVFCDTHALGVRGRVSLFLDVLAAVTHAHSKFILHRDLKPSNIMVTPDGVVKLLDFGIAKLSDAADVQFRASPITQLGGWPLTPEYAAPELIDGSELTMATDVYSLGVVLYVLLCGAHPTAAASGTPLSKLQALLQREPLPLSEQALRLDAARARLRGAAPAQLSRSLHGDLDNILALALKKDAAERYSTVDLFADDLRRYLHHEPVRARANALGYRAWKFVSRNRASVALVSATVLALATSLGISLRQTSRATELTQLAQRERARADSQRDFALRQLARVEAVTGVNSFLITTASPQGKPFRASALLASAERMADQQHTEDPDSRVEMLINIGLDYTRRDADDNAHRVLEKAYRLSMSLSDHALRAKAECAFACALASLGEFARAEQLLTAAESALPSEPQYVTYRMHCLQRGSWVAGVRGDGALALERALEAERLLASAQPESALRRVRVTSDVAAALQLTGSAREANQRFAQAWTQLIAIGHERSETASLHLGSWGGAMLVLGRPVEGEQLYRRALDIEVSGASEEDARPSLLHKLARALLEQDRHDEAASFAERAYASGQRAGSSSVVRQSSLLRAELSRARGELATTASILDEAQPAFQRIPREHIDRAALAMQRALLAQARGDLDGALVAAHEAVSNADKGTYASQYLPRFLSQRSGIWLALGQSTQAIADAQRALAIAEWTAEPALASSSSGHAALALARAQWAGGDDVAAPVTCAAARHMLEDSLGSAHPATLAAEHGCLR